MIADDLRRWRDYFHGEGWRQAFEYLEKLTENSPDVDRVELHGPGVYARIMSYDTLRAKDAVLEAHDRFIDIQMSLAGHEGIDCFVRGELTVKTPYDAERDVVFFQHPVGMIPVKVANIPGRFSVLFPQDAHMPQLALGEPALVKKVVVKVSTEFWPVKM